MDFELSEHQAEFLQADEKFVLLAGGIGSGKSWVGSHWVLQKASSCPKLKGLIAANTYKQLRNSTLSCLFGQLDDLKIPYDYNQSSGVLTLGNAKILCTSLENYDTLRGIEISWFWLDECRDTRQEAFEVIMGRLRGRGKLEGRLTSSPAGFNWMYDYFAGSKKTEDFRMIEATTLDNPFLPDDYIDVLQASYDKKMYQQEVMGRFINITQGPVYYAFDREHHVKVTPKFQNAKIWIGMDFNINPMTAAISNLGDKIIRVFDEAWIMTSNTHEIATHIRDRHGKGHNIVPDATGKALKTSAAGLSDHVILENEGYNVMKTYNPFRMDRYNCVNNLFEKGAIQIDPSCKKLIRDLEMVSYKEGTSLPDTSKDKSLTHISDALGYLCWYINPIAKRSRPTMIPR